MIGVGRICRTIRRMMLCRGRRLVVVVDWCRGCTNGGTSRSSLDLVLVGFDGGTNVGG